MIRGIAPALLTAALLACGKAPPQATREAMPPLAARPEDPDFPRKRPPEPGDWLRQFDEAGQSVREYQETCVIRKREGRETIVLQPMGGILDTHRDTIESVREYAALFWNCPAETADPIPMPEDTWSESRRQHDADRILVSLRNRLPGRALVYIGFCREDLCSEGLNFVFGVGSLRQRVGVYSLARYGTKDRMEEGEPIFLKRTLKVASHELAHLFGMKHCVRYECIVNGSNSVPEMDREPLHLCPDCLEKARWNTDFAVKGRYERLAAFYGRAGFRRDEALAGRQAAKSRP